jgi:hypothetical protein
MSLSRETDDTANLSCHLASGTQASAALDDTDRLWVDASGKNRAQAADGRHAYAEGIIRFYRARTIIHSGEGRQPAARAWRYIKNLSPHDLPASARWHFLEIVWFMQQHAGADDRRDDEFRERVLSIANLIDNYVDCLNSERDRLG